MTTALLLGALAVVALWSLCRAWPGPNRPSADCDWLPAELAGAELVWSEQEFRCHEPLSIAVRIDRAYRKRTGELVLVEFKRRSQPRVWLSDVVELSVQRYVLQRVGHAVSPRAYVVAALPDGQRKAMSAKLESEAIVRRRAERLVALRYIKVSPDGPAHPRVCLGCGHKNACPRRTSC